MRFTIVVILLVMFSGFVWADSLEGEVPGESETVQGEENKLAPDGVVEGLDLFGVLERLDAVVDAVGRNAETVERLEGYLKLSALSLCLLVGGLLADGVFLWVCGRRML